MTTTPYTHDKIIADTATLAQTHLLPKAAAIDQGYYPIQEMQKLGKAGAFLGHLSDYGTRLDTAILATAKIGEVCGTTAFLSWCHQVCGLYLDKSENPKLKARLKTHATADTLGGTALSNPMKTWANIEQMILRAKKQGDGYFVSGTLPWISHIAPNQYCGAVAKIDDTDNELFFLLQFDPERTGKWQLEPCPTFAGMEGSSTWRIVLKDYPVGNDEIIALPCQDFIRQIRGAFVLMQIGIGAGIIQGAINDIHAVSNTNPANAFLEDQAGNLTQALDILLNNTLTLAQTPFDNHQDFFVDVLNTRAQAAMLTLRATQAAMLHQGAKGYLLTSAPQRRLREAQFVAIVTPAIKHLRYLSDTLMREPMPT